MCFPIAMGDQCNSSINHLPQTLYFHQPVMAEQHDSIGYAHNLMQSIVQISIMGQQCSNYGFQMQVKL